VLSGIFRAYKKSLTYILFLETKNRGCHTRGRYISLLY
jgi:hypothetical protein